MKAGLNEPAPRAKRCTDVHPTRVARTTLGSWALVIRSMTGFGEASAQEAGAHYFLELRSLNNKYFKSVIRLPEELQALEPELEAELRRKLTRGTVTLVGKFVDSSEAAAYEINKQALGRYVEQLRDTPQMNGGDVRVDLGPLLALPGVLQPPADEESKHARARDVMLALLAKACEQLVLMRQREGEMLLSELMSQHDAIVERLERVAVRVPNVVEEYHQRLRARVETMLANAGAAVQDADLVREVAIYAEKSDIAEEVQRLSAHMKQYKDLLAGAERPIGRTLDFLAQEMLREANTIASKSGDAEISRDIVEIKGAIDRIKEQVQNVE